MKTTTVRELRTNFPKVERWLTDGEEVQITKRRKIVAMLVPPSRRRRARALPDFAERVRATFGKRTLSAKQSADLRRALRGDRVETFLSFDRRQRALARAAGLRLAPLESLSSLLTDSQAAPAAAAATGRRSNLAGARHRAAQVAEFPAELAS